MKESKAYVKKHKFEPKNQIACGHYSMAIFSYFQYCRMEFYL